MKSGHLPSLAAEALARRLGPPEAKALPRFPRGRVRPPYIVVTSVPTIHQLCRLLKLLQCKTVLAVTVLT